jgi:hypothetical protein
MYDLITQDRNKSVPIRKPSLPYGDELLTYTSLSEQQYSSAWGLLFVPQQYPAVPPHKYYFCSTPAANRENYKVLTIDWPEKENPFTQEDLLDNERELLPELILQLTSSLPVPYRISLANSLLTLFRDAKEEDPNSVGIAIGSLRYFYSFLQSNANLKCPTISLTPEYNIYATWRREKNRLFSVHFLPKGDARFVIFKPNNKHPERKIRISGTATTDVLKETVAPDGVWDWISE